MNLFQLLSNDVVLLILQYVDYASRVEFISSRRDWYWCYMKKFIRRFFLRMKWAPEESMIEKINSLLKDPYHQLSFSLDFRKELPMMSFIPMFVKFDFNFNDLECTGIQFLEIMRSTERLRVSNLKLNILGDESGSVSEETIPLLWKLVDCQVLLLVFNGKYQLQMLPHLTSLQSLTVCKAASISSECLFVYSRSLSLLCLNSCAITDVSMLGSIPHLELQYCDNLVDISSLNDNNHVVIMGCKKIQDFSGSFRNSCRIEIHLGGGSACTLDLGRWRRVTYLKLHASPYGEVVLTYQDNRLPSSVKSCFLAGRFVPSVDFTMTADHLLQELVVSNDDSITGLEGYGLERAKIIGCYSMDRLKSLAGLGRGRNQKITIHRCHNVKDFYLLNHIRMVEISCCRGFSDPFQVSSVYDLTIRPFQKMSFKPDVTVSYPHINIYSLNLLSTDSVSEFDGLQNIPYLRLDLDGFRLLKGYLERGERINNHTIVLQTTMLCDSNPQKYVDIHEKYLERRYSYYNYLPTKWVWIQNR